MFANQHTIGEGIAIYIMLILTATLITMVGVLLTPHTIVILMVYVISIGLLPAPFEIRPFAVKSFIGPILIKRQYFRETHGVNQIALTGMRLASSSHYPVPDLGGFPDLRFARRKGAEAKKGIRSEAVIARDDVGK